MDQGFTNNFWKGSPKENSCEIISKFDHRFQRRFFKDFLWISSCSYSARSPNHQSHVYGWIKILWTVFSSTGCRPARLCHGPLSVMRLSIRALTFSLNIFFSETTYQILMKFHRNVPAMVLFRISWKNLIQSKTLVAMATKLKKIWKLWKSSCQKP